MIDPKELRIGNLVQSPTHNLAIATVSGLQPSSGLIMLVEVLTYDYFESIEPIPLTPDWLVKLGGHPQGGWYGLFASSTVWEEEVSFVFELMPPNVLTIYCNDQRLVLNTLPSVHQLQNAYYVLTGEELTVKEKV